MRLFLIEDYKSINPKLKGRELTDYLILQCLGLENARVLRMEKGKPYVEGGPCFSVSHSSELFAIAVADFNLGLDIQHRRSVDALKIAGRYFSAEETALVEKDRDQFFRLWARKEALAKYSGEGLPQIMGKADVLKSSEVLFMDMKLEDDCFCAICAEKGVKLDEIQISRRK